MLISELMKELQRQMDAFGDIRVKVYSDDITLEDNTCAEVHVLAFGRGVESSGGDLGTNDEYLLICDTETANGIREGMGEALVEEPHVAMQMTDLTPDQVEAQGVTDLDIDGSDVPEGVEK